MSYLLITPAKNEEKNLPKLIQSMVRQTIKPLLWVILDDGSTDKTHYIIKKAQEKHDWIHCVRSKECSRDLSKHYAYVCNRGFDFAIKYSKENNLQYDYIGLVDADMTLEREFYSKLIKEFERSPKLGIASGSVCYYTDKIVMEDDRDDLPSGGGRLWRRECFEETGGYYLSYSPDAVSNVLAQLRGWTTRRFKEIIMIHARRTSSAEGLWRGYTYHGTSAYFRNYHPLFVLVKGLKLTFEEPYYIGIAYLYGYIRAVIRRIDKIKSKEVRDYYYYQKFKEVINTYNNKISKVVKKS